MDPHNPFTQEINSLVAASQRVGYIRAWFHICILGVVTCALIVIWSLE